MICPFLRLLLKKTLVVTNVLSIVLSQSLFANGIVIDTTHTQNNPHLTHSQNNIDIINIAKPSQTGISNNFYQEFNVSQDGLILNNILSKDILANTNLAGLIYSNSNLDSATARLILNQVTGANISEMLGYLEIAGGRADLLIANQNGITCKNCGFINAGNVSLTTGALSKEELNRLNSLREYNENTQISLNIKQGQILVEALDAKNVASLTLLAKNMKVKDSLQAQNLRILLGSNQISFSPINLLYRPIKLNDEDKTEALALDVAYLGSVLSNKIFIVATDEGVGIKNSGLMASNASQHSGDNGFILKANGKIEISKPIEVTTRAGILKVSADELDSTTSQSAKIAPMLYSESSIDIKAKSIENNSIIHAKEDIAIAADSVLSKGSADIEKRVVSKEKFNSWHPTINKAFGSHGDTDKKHTTYTYDIVNYDEYINEDTYSPSMILGKNIRVEANDFINDTGIIYASQSFDNNAASFGNLSPTLRNITNYENGKKVDYDRYGNCVFLLQYVNKNIFCGSTYTSSSFTRASQYSLLDFTAPSIDYSLIKNNSYDAISLALDSINFQPDIYQSDYQSFIISDGFKRHLKNAGSQFVSNNITQATYIAPSNVLSQNNDYMSFRLPTPRNIDNANLKVGAWANSININSTNVLNSSSISSDKNMMVNANFIINNNGKLVSTEGLDLNANTFKQSGGTINAKSIAIRADIANIQSSALFSNSAKQIAYGFKLNSKQDIFKNPYKSSYIDSNSSNTTLGSMASITGDNISISSNKSNISGVNINAKNDIAIKSNSLKIDTIETNDKYGNLAAMHEDTKQIATSISGRNVSLQASKDMNLVSADIKAQNSLALESNGDISIDTAQNTNKSKTEKITTDKVWFFSKTTKTETTQVFKATNITSNFSASNISMNANNINAYNLNTKSDIMSLNAANNLTLSNRADIFRTNINTKTKKKGFTFSLKKGFGMKQDITNTDSKTKAMTHNNAAVNARDMAIQANKNLSIESSDLNGTGVNSSISMRGENVSLLALDDKYENNTTNKTRSNEIRLGINKNGVSASFTHKNETNNSQYSKLSASSSNISANNINIESINNSDIIGSNVTGDSIALSGNNVNILAKKQQNNTSSSTKNHEASISVGVGIGEHTGINASAKYAYSNSNKSSQSISHKDSTIQADNLKINAKNETNIIGSKIDTQNADIKTTSFNLANATDSTNQNEKTINADAEVRASYNGAVGFQASGNYSQESKSSSSSKAHLATLNANNLQLSSSDDTNIIGSNLNVSNQANIQTKDFNVLSAKNTSQSNDYRFGAGGSIGFGQLKAFSVNGSYNKNNSIENKSVTSTLNLGNLNLQSNGNTNIIGSSLNAKSADISTNALNLIVSQDINKGFGFGISGSLGAQNKLNASLSHNNNLNNNNAKLNAQNLNLTAKSDVKLIGANIKSQDMNANIGGNLNISSLQDSKRETKLDFSIGNSKANGSASFKDKKSVGNKSGIESNSMNVQVEGNANLHGSYIQGNNGSFTANSVTQSSIRNTLFDMQMSTNSSKKLDFDYNTSTTNSNISNGIALQTNSSNSISRDEKGNDEKPLQENRKNSEKLKSLIAFIAKKNRQSLLAHTHNISMG